MTKDVCKKNQIGMLGCHVCFAALELFFSVFLTAKLYFVTDGSLGAVALFYIVHSLTLFGLMCAFSYVVKKHSRVWVLRLSALLNVGLVLLTLFWQGGLKDFYLVFAAVGGGAQGVFWCSIHTLECEMVGGEKMAGFMIYYQMASAAVKVIFPFTLGALIDFVDFTAAAGTVLAIGLIFAAFTFLLTESKSDGKPLSMKSYFKLIKKENLLKPVGLNFWVQLLYGIHGTAVTCVTVLVVMSYGNNFDLGLFASVFAACGVAVITVYKLIKPGKIKKAAYFFAFTAPLVASIGLLFGVSPLTILLFHACYTSFGVVPRAESDILRLNLMKNLGHENTFIESNLLTEFSFSVGRQAVMGAVLLIYSLNVLVLFQVLIVLLMALQFFSGFLIRHWQKKYLPSPTAPATYNN